MTSDFLYRKSYWLAIVLVEVVIKISKKPIGDTESVPAGRERRVRARRTREIAG
jgi:hypothetical protein